MGHRRRVERDKEVQGTMTMEPKETFELGVYTFGNTPRTADGGYGPTAQAIRNVLEAVRVAEEVGLDFFGFGEHHLDAAVLTHVAGQCGRGIHTPDRSSARP